MRLLSSLLVAALGGVIGAAPAAPVHLAPAPQKAAAQPPKEGEEGTPQRKQRKPQPAITHVVLRADTERHDDAGAAGDEPLPTLDAAVALRLRRLSAHPAYTAPVRETTGALRAGLLALPPPTA